MARARPTPGSYVEEWKRLWESDSKAIAFNGATCDPTKVDPKVLEWVKENCVQKPHFIKVIVASAVVDRPGLMSRIPSRCMLRFPTPFAKKHFGMLERVVKLENDAGKTWKVAFQSVNWHPTWQQGWFRFACENNLKRGDVLVFVLAEKSHFCFTHFDENGRKINHNNSTSSINPTDDMGVVKKEVSNCTSESHKESGFVWDGEDKHVKGRVSKRNAAVELGTAESCEKVVSSGLGFDRHESMHRASPDKQISSSLTCKRRRLCKVGEKHKICHGRGNLAMNN